MLNFLTATATHQNNPTGALLVEVATGIAITPVDPLDRVWSQDYPIAKQFLMRQVYTKYAAFAAGDKLISGDITYVVRAVHPYAAQGGLDAFYFLVLECATLVPVVPYSNKVLRTDPAACWPLWETAGGYAECLVNSPAQNGAYTGVTLGDGVGPDGSPCPFFDGVNDFVDIYSAILSAAFDGGEGSMMIWAKVNAVEVWTDGANRMALHLGTNTSNNYLRMMKESANNRMQWLYYAGGTADSASKSALSDTDWVMLAMTWSKSADLLQYFYDGSREAIDTGLGTYVDALVETYTNVGSQTESGLLPWHGWLAHCAIWDRPLTQAEIAALAAV